jgi:hypothetical protein
MVMQWYQWMALGSLGICLFICLLHVIRLIQKGKPLDYSRPASNSKNAVVYAFTGAMSPAKKESAFLHLPTYTAGLFYHMGTFLSFSLFFFILAELYPTGWFAIIITAFLLVSAISGIAIFIKRIVKRELRSLSNPDDFISNILVTIFQLITISVLLVNIVQLPNRQIAQLLYYFIFTALMLYVPVGKLRHMVYFFAARYHLGFFFGRRGVWPIHKYKG